MLNQLNETTNNLSIAAQAARHGSPDSLEHIEEFIRLARHVSIKNDPNEVAAAQYWTDQLLNGPLTCSAIEDLEDLDEYLADLQERSESTRIFLSQLDPAVSVQDLIIEAIDKTGKADSREVYVEGHFDVCEWVQALQSLESSGLLPEGMTLPR